MVIPKIIFGIDRKQISHFTTIELHQTINNHHHFKISVPHSVVEKPRAYTIESAQKWLGGVLHIAFENNNNFLGIVTNIQYAQKLGHVGSQIIISGYSKTILLESGSKLNSWEDTNLQDIIEEVIKTATGEQLQNAIKPEFASNLDYQTQYLETDFQFIQRLAKQYNEWLYYDGEKLFFGKPDASMEFTKLVYNKDLSNLNISIQAIPNQFGAFTYNEDANKLYQAKTKDQIEGFPRLGTDAITASQKLYATSSLEYGRIATGDDMYLQTILQNRQQSAAAESNFITATSRNRSLRIGMSISIDAMQVKDKFAAFTSGQDINKINYETNEVGIYIITEITHKASDIGEYENSFKALPAKIRKLPEPNITFPIAQMQQAEVVANDDPKGQGRIRVKMLWQATKQQRTPWLRVMTPDAGTSDEVTTNRGIVFIPEVGDHVMLGFRYNDPNRPFVIGSLFNGKTGTGGQVNNKIKGIHTRTGSEFTFDEGDSSILIKDPSGNKWFMDGDGNIDVAAPKNIRMNAGESIIMSAGQNIVTNAQKDVNIIAGESIIETASENYNLTASNIIENALIDKNCKAKNITENMKKGIYTSTKESINMESADEVNIDSGKEVKI
ncbi:phage baseplate assembly protein V [Flavobacterium sp. LS1R47]|uniref:Phage baseplate assembly protein V n=1 Tax=Flavobacterium frigoritolerans TaxID=2987686 RepID=A0A9X3C820_9FLAO|nr:phage baseplate assembly protein V [Flavobacterium frigoritolerans]MCV9932757.1 phage baseplate assembly protein V [Flavobacterium frigoritolerans]